MLYKHNINRYRYIFSRYWYRYTFCTALNVEVIILQTFFAKLQFFYIKRKNIFFN
jgi:hypothetical protein